MFASIEKHNQWRGCQSSASYLEYMNLQLDSRLGNVTTDGTASMVGKKGVVTLIEKEVGFVKLALNWLNCNALYISRRCAPSRHH